MMVWSCFVVAAIVVLVCCFLKEQILFTLTRFGERRVMSVGQSVRSGWQ